jgi:hypothetical protein
MSKGKNVNMTPNAQAQLPPEQAKPAEGTQSAPALWAVNCSDLLGDNNAPKQPALGGTAARTPTGRSPRFEVAKATMR